MTSACHVHLHVVPVLDQGINIIGAQPDTWQLTCCLTMVVMGGFGKVCYIVKPFTGRTKSYLR